MARRIGILGGMSPESTIAYYEHIVHTYTAKYGDHGYPEIVIYSVTFQPYIDWPDEGRWDLVARGLTEAARRLEAAGADFVIIATNTMHKVLDEIRAGIEIPVLSLMDAVAEAILKRGIKTVGLLGTRFTMEMEFYKAALAERGIEVLIPDADDREYVDRVIYDELVAGVIRDEARAGFIRIIGDLVSRGAEGVILGCTEIPLLVRESDVDVPLFDTTAIHAEAALEYALRA